MRKKAGYLIDLQTIFRPDGTPYPKVIDGLRVLDKLSQKKGEAVLLKTDIHDEPSLVTREFAWIEKHLGLSYKEFCRRVDLVGTNCASQMAASTLITANPQDVDHPMAGVNVVNTAKECEDFWQRLALNEAKIILPTGHSHIESINALGIDMDMVMFNLFAAWNQLIATPGPYFIPESDRPNVLTDHMYQNNFAIKYREKMAGIAGLKGLFYNLPLIEGVREGLEKLSKHHDLVVCSTSFLPADTTNHRTEEKILSLAKNDLLKYFKGQIYTLYKWKTLLKGMVDDSPSLPNHHCEWFKVFVFSQPYNQHVTKGIRINGWGEVDKILSNL